MQRRGLKEALIDSKAICNLPHKKGESTKARNCGCVGILEGGGEQKSGYTIIFNNSPNVYIRMKMLLLPDEFERVNRRFLNFILHISKMRVRWLKLSQKTLQSLRFSLSPPPWRVHFCLSHSLMIRFIIFNGRELPVDFKKCRMLAYNFIALHPPRSRSAGGGPRK